MAPPPSTPTRAELVRNLQLLLERTAPMTEGAALHGVSLNTLRRMIRRGEVPQVIVGRDVRVWRDDV